MNKLLFLLFLLLFTTSVNAYENENRLEALITGKIAKFISWSNKNSPDFIIGVYKNQLNTIFDDVYRNATIKSKRVKIEYIKNIKSVKNLQDIEILYISSQASSAELKTILTYIKNKNILTISHIRGFAQKGGMIQLYTKNQRLKLRINLDNVQKENIKIKASLLRISDVIRESK